MINVSELDKSDSKKSKDHRLKFSSPLKEGIILKRYKRFLADVKIDHETITVHVPNTGSMETCWQENWKCAISKSLNPDRKLPYTLEMTHNQTTWIGVNTSNANKLAHEWISNHLITELKAYEEIFPEKKIGESRIDFYLKGKNLPDCYVEVKNVTLIHEGLAQFPDAITTRGQKHLLELIKLKKLGYRAVLLFVIQREDCHQFSPATHIDPEYSKLLKEAFDQGVEILCYQAKLSVDEINFGRQIPFLLK